VVHSWPKAKTQTSCKSHFWSPLVRRPHKHKQVMLQMTRRLAMPVALNCRTPPFGRHPPCWRRGSTSGSRNAASRSVESSIRLHPTPGPASHASFRGPSPVDRRLQVRGRWPSGLSSLTSRLRYDRRKVATTVATRTMRRWQMRLAPRHAPDHLTRRHPDLGRSSTVTELPRRIETVRLQTTVFAACEMQRSLTLPTERTP
jgi:hypothetical protein